MLYLRHYNYYSASQCMVGTGTLSIAIKATETCKDKIRSTKTGKLYMLYILPKLLLSAVKNE